MKRIITLLFITSLFFSACNSDKKNNAPISASRTKTTLRSFTDTAKLDTFKVILKGDQPKNMELIFSITPENGQPIYTKILKAKELLDNYKENIDLGKKKKQIQFIEQELNLFFDEENFLEPAVTGAEEPDKNMPDKKFFEELKHSGLNGFQYRLGKESKIYIAWSAKEKQVKPYYECCK